MIRPLFLFLFALALAACSREEEPAPAEKLVADAGDNPFLVYVPASTPYFFGTRQALDESLALEMMKRTGYSYDSIKAQIADARDMASTVGSGAAKFLDVADALLDEIGDFADASTYQRLGTKVNAQMALYAIGLMPVARLEIGNRANFSAFVDRVVEIAELEPVRAPHGEGRSLLRFDVKDAAILVSIGDQDVAVTAIPADASADAQARLLGDVLPASNIATARTLQAMEREHGFTPYMLGRVDTASLLAELESPTLPLFEGMDTSEFFAAEHCRDEMHAVAARYPGLALGTRRFDADVMEMSLIFLTDEEIAADLATLPAAVPGMGQSSGLVSFGFGMQLPKLGSLLNKWAGAMSQSPFACERLAALNGMSENLRKAAANPGLLMAGPAASGLFVRLDSMDLSNFLEPGFAGILTLASPSPQALLAMGSNFLPPLAELGLTPGGEAKALPQDLMQGPLESAFVALDDSAIALAVNTGNGEAARAALAAPVGAADLMLHVHLHGEAYRILADALAEAEPDNRQMQRLAADLRRNADIFESGEVGIHTTGKGVELRTVTRFN